MRWKTLAIKIGNNMRMVRRKSGLTQEKAAEKAHLSLRYWQQLESAQKNMTLKTLTLISRTLDISVTEIVSLESFPKHPKL
jgi:transcriptional regulator with XRE-family HTH domain